MVHIWCRRCARCGDGARPSVSQHFRGSGTDAFVVWRVGHVEAIES